MILVSAILALTTTVTPHSEVASQIRHFGRWLLTENKMPNSIQMMSPGDHWEQHLYFQATDGVSLSIEATRLGVCITTADGVELATSSGCDSGVGLPTANKEARFLDEVLMHAPSAQALSEMRAARDDFITAVKVMREDANDLYGGVIIHRPIRPCRNCVY